MPAEVEVPKGLTLIDPNQAPKGTDAAGVTVPKGLTLIGGPEQKTTPKFGPEAQAQPKATPAPPADLKGPVPAGLTLLPKEYSHIETFMEGIRKPA